MNRKMAYSNGRSWDETERRCINICNSAYRKAKLVTNYHLQDEDGRMIYQRDKPIHNPRQLMGIISKSVASSPKTFQTRHEISNNLVCVTSKSSDQPAHTRSLIRAFASR